LFKTAVGNGSVALKVDLVYVCEQLKHCNKLYIQENLNIIPIQYKASKLKGNNSTSGEVIYTNCLTQTISRKHAFTAYRLFWYWMFLGENMLMH